jgi:glycosyltransferase involved in cell wall biosynthesis
MKIAIASSGLGHVARGVEAWAADIGRALARRNLDVTLYKGAGRAEQPYEMVIPCWQRSDPRTHRLMRWLPKRGLWRIGLGSVLGIEQTTFTLGLISHLRREKFDILHTHEPQSAYMVEWARRLGLVRTRPILGNATNEPPEFLATMAYVQHLSPWHLDEMRRGGVFKPAWRAIPNFIDTQLFRPQQGGSLRSELGIPPNGLLVLSAAAIKSDHKRIDYLLQEFAGFRNARPDCPAWLVVAGAREPDTDHLMRVGRELLGDRVRFLVSWPRNRMPELYQAADLFVLCSLREMFGIVLIEATASGLPCLVHGHPVIESIVGPGGTAIEMTRQGALAEGLAAYLNDPAKCREVGQSAREHCVAQFSEGPVVDQILAYYQFVLEGQRTLAAMKPAPHGKGARFSPEMAGLSPRRIEANGDCPST